MTNITKLYQQLQEGKTTRDYFVKEARRQFPQFISPVSSFNDIVNILKGKRLVTENLTKEVSGAGFDAIGEATADENLQMQEMSDSEIEKVAYQLGIEDSIVRDGEGGIANTEEMITLIKQSGENGEGDAYGPNDGPSHPDRAEASWLTEAHKLDTEQILDRMSPYAVKKGIEVELKKEKVVDKTTLDKVRARVAKKLQKNREAYNDLILANVKSVDKQDKDLETKEVKQELVDKKNAMRKPKGFKADKANTKASKKENRKGKPKGVKVMPDKGVIGTEKILKEDVLNSLKAWLQENVYREYHEGMEVKTPDGQGVVKEVRGGTLMVELQDEEKTQKYFQFNEINHVMDKEMEEPSEPVVAPEEKPVDPDKAARDAAFAKLPNLGSVRGNDGPLSKLFKQMSYGEKLKAIMEKVQSMEEGEKKQKALEIVKKKLKEAKALVVPKTATPDQINKMVSTDPTIKVGTPLEIIKK